MTNKGNRRIMQIVVAAVILTLLIVIVSAFFNRNYSWIESYEPDDSNPYGTKVLYTLLKKSRSQQNLIKITDSTYKDLPINNSKRVDSYIYIGSKFYADSSDVEQIKKFVEAGNKAFIITPNPNRMIADSLLLAQRDNEGKDEYNYEDEDGELYGEILSPIAEQAYIQPRIIKSYTDTSSVLGLKEFNNGNPYLSIGLRFRDKKRVSEWYYFPASLKTRDGKDVITLGTIEGSYPNYIRFAYGKGYFYLHTTPLAFTNYYMINDTTMNYCRDALSYLGDGNIYWDEENRSYHPSAVPSNAPLSKPGEGPLEFILSEQGLRQAWYLLLVGTILYLMFGAKRKQRIIPVMENMENTSIEYAEVISQMFMKQKDHKKLAQMKMELFKSFLKERFRIKLSPSSTEITASSIEEISQKSNIPIEKVKDIFDQFEILNISSEVRTEQLLTFHKKLEQFYTLCK